jgi:outer membrane protein insertion porin family
VRAPTITFQGNAQIPTADLLAAMRSNDPDDPALADDPSGLLERDVLNLTSLYYDRGFVTVQLDPPAQHVDPNTGNRIIAITIHEGPPYRIGALAVHELDANGHDVTPLGGKDKARALFTSSSGDFFGRANVAAAVQAIQRLYTDAGYAFVEVAPVTALHTDERLIDLDVQIHRGALARIERVEIYGNTRTDEKTVRGFVQIASKDRYSETKLQDAKRALERSGRFTSVAIATSHPSAKPTVIIRIELVER